MTETEHAGQSIPEMDETQASPTSETTETPLTSAPDLGGETAADVPTAEQPSGAEAAESAAPPAIDPAQFLEQLSARPLGEAEAAMKQLIAENHTGALSALAFVAQRGALALATKAMDALVALRSEEAANALAGVGADRSDPTRAKAARRALYKLSLAGIKPDPASVMTRAQPEPDKVHTCLASPIDASGVRSVVVVRQNRFGTLRLATFNLHEDDGVIDVYVADPCSMANWKRYLALLQAGDAKPVPVELAFCRRQVEVAVARNERSHTPLPEAFPMAMSILAGPSEERPRPPELDPDLVRNNPDLLSKSAGLIELPECRAWQLPTDAVRPHATRLVAELRREQIEQENRQEELDLLDLSQVQRQGTIISMAINAVFDGALRSIYEERLAYTADILWRADRLEHAQWAMAAALAMASDSTLPLEQHPFLRRLMVQSMIALAEEAVLTVAEDEEAGEGNEPEEYVDEQGFIRRKSGLILPR